MMIGFNLWIITALSFFAMTVVADTEIINFQLPLSNPALGVEAMNMAS
jgi:hypothetical protein